jgi:hypothetical protein
LLAVFIHVLEPMDIILKTEVNLADHHTPEQIMATHTLYNQVYEDELAAQFRIFMDVIHLLGCLGQSIVTTACPSTAGSSPATVTAFTLHQSKGNGAFQYVQFRCPYG